MLIKAVYLTSDPIRIRSTSTEYFALLEMKVGPMGEQGVWGDDGAQHVRNITWEVENPRALVDKYAGRYPSST